jgi:protein-S-isoprenylcysteine O-methyltransferase Ste14
VTTPRITVVVLLFWLWFHRAIVHRGFRDLMDARGGTSPFTTWAVVLETFSLATFVLIAAWIPLREMDPPWFAVGNVLAFAACAVGLWARRTLGKHFSIHLTTDKAKGHDLVTSGPYRWVRHPVYTGDLLFQLSLPLIAGAYEGLAFPVLYFFLVRSRMGIEETMLSQEYAEYAPYMERSHRLFPGIY